MPSIRSSTQANNTRIALFVLFVLVVGYFFFSGTTSGGDVGSSWQLKGCPIIGRRYGVMLDAGSTGSRVHAYEFEYKSNGAVTLIDELFEQVKPGLSAYKDSPREAAESLRPLLDSAVRRIPKDLHKCTPVELKATAGLRLIGKERSEAILQAVLNIFREFPFVVSGPEAAIVMDGKDEGPYAWMTVNFLLQTLSSMPNTPKTAAIIDMGGASTQIVFKPDEDRVMSDVVPEMSYQVSTESYRSKVYTHSHLGYGLKQAGKRMMMAARDRGEGHSFPCFPKGTTETLEGIRVSNDEGAQSFDKCLMYSDKILEKSKPCTASACSFNGVAQPQLSTTFSGPVYAFSYYYDRMEPFLSKEGVSTVGGLREMAESVCSSADEPYAAHNKGTYCMDLTFLYSVLRTGYDMPDSTKLYVKKKINGIETAWTLGAMMAAMKAK